MSQVNLQDLPVANFPDGHKHLIIPEDHPAFKATSIKVALRNFDDVFLLAQAAEIFHNIKHCYITYMLAARCDRSFAPGEAFDLRFVTYVINKFRFKTIKVLRPHSPVTLELLRNSIEADVTPALISGLRTVYDINDFAIVSPDKGASLWVGKYAELFNAPLVQCDKSRNMNEDHRGVVGLMVPHLPEGIEDFVIVDDLCDGGGTFLALSAQLRKQGAKRVFLVVTHAIMSKGLDVFDDFIDGIYCTNSFAEFEHDLVHQINV